MELIKKEAPGSRFMGQKRSWPGLTPQGWMAAPAAPAPPGLAARCSREAAALPGLAGLAVCVG